MLDTLLLDIRYSIRVLLKNKTFTAMRCPII
jgi:hypothetical protein